MSKANNKSIFISHSVKDKEIADALADLIITGGSVQNNDIFCSSLEGLGIPKGKNFIEYIKEQLQQPLIVIMILSPNYFDSNFCICELGAAWALSHNIFPLLVPPMEYSQLKDVLTAIQVGKIDDKSDLDDLKDLIVKCLNIKNISTARWDAKKSQFLEKIKIIMKKSSPPSKVSYSEFKKIQDKYSDSIKEVEQSQKEIDKLNELVQELKNCKDKQETSVVIKKHSNEWELYESLTTSVKCALEGFPHIIIEALYYTISDKDFVPNQWEQDKWSDIKTEQENGYLNIDESVITVNTDDLEISKALEALEELKSFIKFQASSDFIENYQEENKFIPDLSNKRFWHYSLGIMNL